MISTVTIGTRFVGFRSRSGKTIARTVPVCGSPHAHEWMTGDASRRLTRSRSSAGGWVAWNGDRRRGVPDAAESRLEAAHRDGHELHRDATVTGAEVRCRARRTGSAGAG